MISLHYYVLLYRSPIRIRIGQWLLTFQIFAQLVQYCHSTVLTILMTISDLICYLLLSFFSPVKMFCHTGYIDMIWTGVWQIYLNIWIFLIQNIWVFVHIIFGYKYIQIFVLGKILIQIYSDIGSYQFSGHKNIQKIFLLMISGYYT